MEANAIKCPVCLDTVFSRCRHDFRSCSCGELSIDGGFDYVKISFAKTPPRIFQINILQTKDQLFQDWRLEKDKFGLIKTV